MTTRPENEGCSKSVPERARIRALQKEKLSLFVHSARISRQAAVRTYHAVAGDYDGNPVMAYRAAYGLCRHMVQAPFPADRHLDVFPIPKKALDGNPKLVQNPGYAG